MYVCDLVRRRDRFSHNPFQRGLEGRHLLHDNRSHPYRGGFAPILQGKVSPVQLELARGGEKPVPPPLCIVCSRVKDFT